MRLHLPLTLGAVGLLVLAAACSGTAASGDADTGNADTGNADTGNVDPGSVDPGAPAPGEPVPTGPPPLTSEPAPPPPEGPGPPEPAEAGAYREAASESGAFTLRWRPLAPDVPNNEPFELEFVLEREGRPYPGAKVRVRGWMPDHGHGMLRRPEVEDRGDGSYLVRGMLFHMGGFWELFFDLYEPDRPKDPVRFELHL